MIFEIEHPVFKYERLLDSPENLDAIKEFSIFEPKGAGLENYLKNFAEYDEKNGLAATYLVKDKESHEIAGYFSLKAGLFTISAGNENAFDDVPAVELSNFAVNSLYRQRHKETEKIGMTMLKRFVIPLVQHVKNFVAVRALYIYALPEEKLMRHYADLGFSRLDDDEEKFVHEHVKPQYDADCIFMYQTL